MWGVLWDLLWQLIRLWTGSLLEKKGRLYNFLIVSFNGMLVKRPSTPKLVVIQLASK